MRFMPIPFSATTHWYELILPYPPATAMLYLDKYQYTYFLVSYRPLALAKVPAFLPHVLQGTTKLSATASVIAYSCLCHRLPMEIA